MKGGFFGVDVSLAGDFIVARQAGARDSQIVSYPRTGASYVAIQDEIRASGDEPSVCIRSRPETAEIAQALTGVRGIRITMVPGSAIDPSASDHQIARYLARLALELA
ncbi:MAG: hypothetical protein JO035_15290 [Betaproteobacteria bacterium]|nr:hypothetical protein [Betaproteobacteria bacterium]